MSTSRISEIFSVEECMWAEVHTTDIMMYGVLFYTVTVPNSPTNITVKFSGNMVNVSWMYTGNVVSGFTAYAFSRKSTTARRRRSVEVPSNIDVLSASALVSLGELGLCCARQVLP